MAQDTTTISPAVIGRLMKRQEAIDDRANRLKEMTIDATVYWMGMAKQFDRLKSTLYKEEEPNMWDIIDPNTPWTNTDKELIEAGLQAKELDTIARERTIKNQIIIMSQTLKTLMEKLLESSDIYGETVVNVIRNSDKIVTDHKDETVAEPETANENDAEKDDNEGVLRNEDN